MYIYNATAFKYIANFFVQLHIFFSPIRAFFSKYWAHTQKARLVYARVNAKSEHIH